MCDQLFFRVKLTLEISCGGLLVSGEHTPVRTNTSRAQNDERDIKTLDFGCVELWRCFTAIIKLIMFREFVSIHNSRPMIRCITIIL